MLKIKLKKKITKDVRVSFGTDIIESRKQIARAKDTALLVRHSNKPE